MDSSVPLKHHDPKNLGLDSSATLRRHDPRDRGLDSSVPLTHHDPKALGLDSSVTLTYHDLKGLGLICLAKKRKIHFWILSDLSNLVPRAFSLACGPPSSQEKGPGNEVEI